MCERETLCVPNYRDDPVFRYVLFGRHISPDIFFLKGKIYYYTRYFFTNIALQTYNIACFSSQEIFPSGASWLIKKKPRERGHGSDPPPPPPHYAPNVLICLFLCRSKKFFTSSDLWILFLVVAVYHVTSDIHFFNVDIRESFDGTGQNLFLNIEKSGRYLKMYSNHSSMFRIEKKQWLSEYCME